MRDDGSEIIRLRTQLRAVNIEYSALVRSAGGEDRALRLGELTQRRKALMTLIAQASHEHRVPVNLPASAAAAVAA